MGNRLPPWQFLPGPAEPSGANNRMRRRGELDTGLKAGLIVAVVTVVAQMHIDDRREVQADRRENVRFVRQLAADGTAAKGTLRGMDLSDSNLSGLNLAGVDLTGADLSGSDLTSTHLTGATMNDADLTGARLESTVLAGAHLTKAILVDAKLIDPIMNVDYSEGATAVAAAQEQGIADASRPLSLTGANLSGATIENAHFEGTILDQANFSEAIFVHDPKDPGSFTSFLKADMFGTKFYGSDLSKTVLPGTDDLMGQLGFLTACFDEHTKWPELYPVPVESSEAYCKGSEGPAILDRQLSPGVLLYGLPLTAVTSLP